MGTRRRANGGPHVAELHRPGTRRAGDWTRPIRTLAPTVRRPLKRRRTISRGDAGTGRVDVDATCGVVFFGEMPRGPVCSDCRRIAAACRRCMNPPRSGIQKLAEFSITSQVAATYDASFSSTIAHLRFPRRRSDGVPVVKKFCDEIGRSTCSWPNGGIESAGIGWARWRRLGTEAGAVVLYCGREPHVAPVVSDPRVATSSFVYSVRMPSALGKPSEKNLRNGSR